MYDSTSQHHEEDHQGYAEAFLSNWFNANSFHTVRVKNGYDGNNGSENFHYCHGSESFRDFDGDLDEPLSESLRRCVSSVSHIFEAQDQDRKEDVNGKDCIEEYEDDANEFNASYNTFCRACSSNTEDRRNNNNNNESASSNASSGSGPSMIISLDYQSKEDDNPDMHNNTGLSAVSELDDIDRALQYSIQRRSSHAPAPDKQTSFRAPDKQISFHAPAQQSWSRRRSNSLVILPTLSQRRENAGTGSQRTNAQTTANNIRRKPKRQVVSWLPWRDDRGTLGHYTGQVNERRQPDGRGALIYEGGSAKTSIWKNGTPIRFWIPGEKKKKKKKTRSSGVNKKQMSSSNRNDISNFDRSTFLPHLDLGDAGTTRDMILFEHSPSIALKIMNSLRVHDFAFIQRSSGQWTYAIIAEKREDAIRFVVNGNGDTKTLSKKHWYTSIRWANPEEAC